MVRPAAGAAAWGGERGRQRLLLDLLRPFARARRRRRCSWWRRRWNCGWSCCRTPPVCFGRERGSRATLRAQLPPPLLAGAISIQLAHLLNQPVQLQLTATASGVCSQEWLQQKSACPNCRQPVGDQLELEPLLTAEPETDEERWCTAAPPALPASRGPQGNSAPWAAVLSFSARSNAF